MAVDFLLLQRYPEPAAVRFRHYDWRRPAFTFGYSQKIAEVRAALPAGETLELCRRATGGGIVDHRHDWTYALVVPRGHPLEEARATDAYRAVHQALADALAALGQPVELARECAPCEDGPKVCFTRAEVHDVVHRPTGAKVAGAAMKRNKHGLLLQGSIEKTPLGPVDWDAFAADFTSRLATALGAEAHETPWPDLNDDEVTALTDQYSTPEWIEYR